MTPISLFYVDLFFIYLFIYYRLSIPDEILFFALLINNYAYLMHFILVFILVLLNINLLVRT